MLVDTTNYVNDMFPVQRTPIRKTVLTRHDRIIKFFKDNELSVANNILFSRLTIPPVMKKPDERFFISKVFVVNFTDEFHNFEDKPSKGYDMLYDVDIKFSVKSKEKIFQPVLKNGRLGVVPGLELVNMHGKNMNRSLLPADCFDYLFGIESRICSDHIHVVFGVTRLEQFNKEGLVFPSGDQIRCKIPSGLWDYKSEVYRYYGVKYDPAHVEKEFLDKDLRFIREMKNLHINNNKKINIKR